MQYSKADEGQLIGRIQRLKEDINAATEYSHLEKCSHRLAKLNERANAILKKQTRNALKEMCAMAQDLIRQKTKKFKKRIIEQITRGSLKEDSPFKEETFTSKDKNKAKTLAYSKSLDCFDLPPPTKLAPKDEEEASWKNRTEVYPKNEHIRLQRRVEQLEDEVASYKRKQGKLEKGRSSATLTQLCLRLGEQEGLFEQQLGFKVREKALEADELRERLRRSEERATELKNRLLNEQKRQQDYIQGLKGQLSASGQQIEVATRENRRLQEQLNKMYFVCDGYKTEVRRLMEESEQLRRERSQAQQAELLRLKDNGMRRELQEMQQQDRYMRQMQSLLQAEQDQNAVLQTQVEQLEKRNRTLQAESDELLRKNEKLQELVEIKEEEAAQVKEAMVSGEKDKKACIAELVEAREIITQLRNQLESGKLKRSLQLQKKAQSLRQIKEMLENK